jgi:hypothetical protein
VFLNLDSCDLQVNFFETQKIEIQYFGATPKLYFILSLERLLSKGCLQDKVLL